MTGRSIRILWLAVAVTSCVPGGQPPGQLLSPFRPITLAELGDNPARFVHEKVAFSATIDRVEETTKGTWLHLKDGEDEVVLFMAMSFAGTLRESLGADRMDFEVEVGEKKLTSLGTLAIEVLPYQISKTRYFEQAVPIEPPKPVE